MSQLSLMSSQKISYVSQFHQNCIQQHQKRQSYIQTQSLRPGEVARAHQIVPPECHHRNPAEDGQLTDPVQNLLQTTQNRLQQEGNQIAKPQWCMAGRQRQVQQIEGRTAIHLRNFSQFLCRIYQKPHQIFPESKQKNLRNFSNSYAESIRNLTKSFQNPDRKSQKLLQFLCRIYQKPHQIFPESRQKISETSPIPMQNL